MDYNAATESRDTAEACVGLPPNRDTRQKLPWWLQLSWAGIGVVLATFFGPVDHSVGISPRLCTSSNLGYHVLDTAIGQDRPNTLASCG